MHSLRQSEQPGTAQRAMIPVAVSSVVLVGGIVVLETRYDNIRHKAHVTEFVRTSLTYNILQSPSCVYAQVVSHFSTFAVLVMVSSCGNEKQRRADERWPKRVSRLKPTPRGQIKSCLSGAMIVAWLMPM